MNEPDASGGPPSGDEKQSGIRIVAGVEIPAPPPGHNLDRTGMRLYDWICLSLIEDGRKIRAAGIQILMIVHTLRAWAEDMALVVKMGRYGEGKDGGSYEYPHSYNERKGRAEIKDDLPEACLTVMSQVEARLKESKIGGGTQDELWPELIAHATGSRGGARRH